MGNRKSTSIPCNSRKPTRQPSTSSPIYKVVTHGIACAEDNVYCTVCKKKEGDDFLLCDACDGGMHRQCAKLDHIPASTFWACTICKDQPTVESAIRQVLHEHSSSGLSEKQLLIKARQQVPLGISGPAELARGLEQALSNKDSTHFAREYRVVRLKDRYHLVTTAAADPSRNQHLLPDGEDEQSSIRSSHTLGSVDDSPSIHRKHVKHKISHSRGSSRRHSCLVEPLAFKGHQQEGPGSGGGHPSAHDSARARSNFNQQHCHSYQKSGIADRSGADTSHWGALSLAAAESVIPGQTKGGSVEQHGARMKTRGHNRCQEASKPCFASSTCHGPATLVQTELNQQQSSVAEPQSSGMQASQGFTRLQQQQGSSLDGASPEPLGCKSEDLIVDSNPSDEQLAAQAVEAPPANAVQELSLQQASLDIPLQLPSAEDPGQGAAQFLSTMTHGDIMALSAQLQRSRLFEAASRLVGLARYTKSFEQHLDTLSSNHAARVVHTVCARIMASSKVYTPEMAGIFIQQYWQSLAAC